MENILKSLNIFEERSITNVFNFVSYLDPSFIFDNSFVVVIFTPLVFFLFIFAEDVKFKFEKICPLLSLIFAIIILSTAIVTPYSISSVYWPEAYADSGYTDEPIYDNTTTSTDNASSSSTPAENTESTEASSSNNTSTEIIPVNSTTISGTNSTIPVIVPNSTESWSFDTKLMAPDSLVMYILKNLTLASFWKVTDTSQMMIIPQAIYPIYQSLPG